MNSSVVELNHEPKNSILKRKLEVDENNLKPEDCVKRNPVKRPRVDANEIKLAKQKAFERFMNSLHQQRFSSNLKSNEQNNNNWSPEQIASIKNIKYFTGVLRPYQVDGVMWMKDMIENKLNGILADEMGLGKTVQVIAFLAHLFEIGTRGPYIIMVPLSTVPNWQSEFKRFAPTFEVYTVQGAEEHCNDVLKKFLQKYRKSDTANLVLLIGHHNAPKYGKKFREVSWSYGVVDEAQCIKNPNGQRLKIYKSFNFKNLLLVTGTPLQNDISELWSLLSILHPSVFYDVDTFASLIMLEEMKSDDWQNDDEINKKILTQVQEILDLLMLRRLKVDVMDDIVPKKEVFIYCPIPPEQKALYVAVLNRRLAVITNEDRKKNLIIPKAPRTCVLVQQNRYKVVKEPRSDIDAYLEKANMLSPIIVFKKVVSHPYLIRYPEHYVTDEDFIKASGKMIILDAMLAKLKAQRHKVLLFSTYKISLNFIEDLCNIRHYNYERLDGDIVLEERAASIDNFNNNEDVFIFLISVRAGGLGLNLTGADTVIFYDRDWNPQVDIQAKDRCHRIGQTRPIVIYSLIMKNTIDEYILAKADMKMKLEQLIMNKSTSRVEKDLFEEWKRTLENKGKSFKVSDAELERLMDRSDIEREWMEKQKLMEIKKNIKIKEK